MSIKLQPCPNCGGQPKIHKTHKKFYVECDGDCWTQTGKHSYQEDAVKEWNTQIAVAKEGRQMTDPQFTEEQIIEALEIRMPHDAVCREAYDLINRQKAEIERLNKEVDRLSQCVLYHDGIVSDLEKDLFDARAEAIKEFAERLKANMSNIARMEYGGNTYFCVGYDLIDTLVKEMTEGKNA